MWLNREEEKRMLSGVVILEDKMLSWDSLHTLEYRSDIAGNIGGGVYNEVGWNDAWCQNAKSPEWLVLKLKIVFL